jgi:hypothetical protein
MTSSGTLTPSQTASQTLTGTPSATQTPSVSGTLSQSPSQSPTLTQTPTQTTSLLGPAFFDGTADASAPVDAVSFSAVDSQAVIAVSFTLNESDAGCGPGRWSLTQLVLPLSRVTDPVVDLQLRIFAVNVRHREYASEELFVFPKRTVPVSLYPAVHSEPAPPPPLPRSLLAPLRRLRRAAGPFLRLVLPS